MFQIKLGRIKCISKHIEHPENKNKKLAVEAAGISDMNRAILKQQDPVMAECYTSDGDFDWKKYANLVKDIDILTYDPPQKKPAYVGRFRHLNFFTPRSPWFTGFPCCVSEAVRCYLRRQIPTEMQDV